MSYDITPGYGQLRAPVTKTGDYTVAAADCVILCNPANGDITITLRVTDIVPGKVYNVKRITSLLHVLTIVVAGGALIDGAASVIVSDQFFENIQVVFDGTNYYII